MKNERIFNPAVIAAVALLHIGLLALLWRSVPPAQVGMEHIEFVDLGSLGGGDGAAGNGTPAAVELQPLPTPQPKPKVEAPKPKVKPVEPEKPLIKPVVTKRADADIQQPKEPPKPVDKPKSVEKTKPVEAPKPEVKAEPKPVPQANPAPKAPEKPAEKAAGNAAAEGAKSVGSSAAKSEGNGRGEGSGKGSGGAKGDSGEGSGGSGGDTGPGSSRSNPVKASSGQLPTPPYPPLAEENGEEGTVGLSVLVAPGGKVADVKVTKSSGSPRLDRAARNAAKAGRFNASVWTQFSASVRFELK